MVNSALTSSAGLFVQVHQEGPIPLNAELHCQGGEVLGLVGPSGSGKTTMLRCIAGLYTPLQGKVTCCETTWLNTEQHIDIPPQRRRAGLLFQNFALFPHLSALDNVRLALNNIPRQARTGRAVELLERVHLAGLESRLPSMLSGGQQQRVALARALAREPQVLLLDEPFSAVDQVTRRKLRLEMAQLTKHLSIPIILVTHDLDEACMLANRLCVLHGGETRQQGVPQEVLRHPKDATVARLIDVRNLFEGEVREHRPEQNLSWLSWQGYKLEAAYSPDFAIGSKITWCIPPTDVLLHRRVQPSRGVKENPVKGYVCELVTIGAVTSIIIDLDARRETKLSMDLPPHVVKRNSLKVGDEIGVSLLKNAIHIMPWQTLDGEMRGAQ